MATDLEARWMENMAALAPRFIESEGVWCVAYDNEFCREVDRFATKKEAEEFVMGFSDNPSPQPREDVPSPPQQEPARLREEIERLQKALESIAHDKLTDETWPEQYWRVVEIAQDAIRTLSQKKEG
ncbi:MAG: hypothetical protein ACK4P4_22275 [Allorhizobium sp.]